MAKIEEAQYMTAERHQMYKIGAHGRMFMWVNDEWIKSQLSFVEVRKQCIFRKRDGEWVDISKRPATQRKRYEKSAKLG